MPKHSSSNWRRLRVDKFGQTSWGWISKKHLDGNRILFIFPTYKSMENTASFFYINCLEPMSRTVELFHKNQLIKEGVQELLNRYRICYLSNVGYWILTFNHTFVPNVLFGPLYRYRPDGSPFLPLTQTHLLVILCQFRIPIILI